jgi:cytochrome c oxidase subunit 2
MLNKLLGILPNASEHGYQVDLMLEVCHWFMALLFVGWTGFFLYMIWRFHRSRNPKADYHGVQSKASAHLEFTVVLIEAVLLLGFALPLWGKRVNEDQFPDKTDAIRVHAVGEQFAWNFHYPGPDGVFGRRSIEFVTGNNPLGIDPNDPAGQDDLVSKNELHLVNHKPVVIEVSSKDVIHSLSLEHMRMCQDAIPGSLIPMWFRPIVAGEYEIVCAQLCGPGHYQMRANMTVETQAEFDAWFKEASELYHPKKAAAAAPVTPVAAPATPGK